MQDVWPWLSEDEYVNLMYSCYDDEVMERAFSETIYRPVDELGNLIAQAQEQQELAWFLEDLLFGFL
jgi:hypothetical protein